MSRCSTSAPGQACQFLPPVFRRKIQIRRPHQVSHAAAFVRLLDARPDVIELGPQRFQFVGQHQGARQQIENRVIGAGHRRIKLPSRKNGYAAGAHGLLDDFLVAGNALPGETGMHRAQKFFADRSFGQRQQQRFIHGIRRALGGGIKLPDGLDLIAKKLDAHRALSFRRIHIENAAAQGIFSGHLDHVGGVIADRVEVGEQRVDVEHFAAANGPRQIGVVLGRAQAKGGGGNRRNHKRCRAGGDFPQRDRPLFLDLRMRGQILEGQHVVVGKGDHGFGIGGPGQFTKSLQHRNQVFRRAIVGDHDNQRAPGRLLQQDQKQSFCGRDQSGDTNPPRALFQMGGHTRKGRQLFHVREEITNEGENHAA